MIKEHKQATGPEPYRYSQTPLQDQQDPQKGYAVTPTEFKIDKKFTAREVEAPLVRYVERGVQLIVFGFTSSVATGDGAGYFHIDQRLDKYNLVDVHAEVIVAGVSGTTSVQINNTTQATDMLAEKIHIDSGETGSDTATTPAVINQSKKFVNLHDLLRVDVDAVNSEAPAGLLVTLGFRKA